MSERPHGRATGPRQPGPSNGFPVLPVALAALALVVALGIAVALAGGDDDDTATTDLAQVGEVAIDGDPLPELESSSDDPAIGLPAPSVRGSAPDGEAVELGGSGEPTLVVFLVHWCPHCQAELPLLVDLAEDGAFDAVRTVAVLTGTNPQAPNYPPTSWLDREGWAGDVLLDDEASSTGRAFGLASYPMLVALDADGAVVGRVSGEQPAEVVTALVEAAAA